MSRSVFHKFVRFPVAALVMVSTLLAAALGAAGIPVAYADSRTTLSATQGPAQQFYLPALAFNLGHPGAMPAGTNDPACQPGPTAPRPVILVHGTWVGEYGSYARLAPYLAARGVCVYAFEHGEETNSAIAQLPPVRGTGDIDTSSDQLAQFVATVQRVTGQKQVDLVGYSLGAPLIRNYLRFHGGADSGAVHSVISLAGTNHGTTFGGITDLGAALSRLGLPTGDIARDTFGISPTQQVVGSPFLNRLNAAGDTQPGVVYTALATEYDTIATPYTTGFLTPGPGATVTNVRLQDGCPIDLSDHLSFNYSPRTLSIVASALRHNGVPDPRDYVCVPALPVLGG